MTLLDTGLPGPMSSTWARRATSIRRTSNVDMTVGPPPMPAPLTVDGSCRDLVTDGTGAHVINEASVHAEVREGRTLVELAAEPSSTALGELIGLGVGRGFRAAVDAHFESERAIQSPLYALLTELPVAALLSGYATLYTDPTAPSLNFLPKDVCAGWRSDGSMMVTIADTGHIPITIGPPAPVLEGDDDLGWHEMATLLPGQMRRRRLLDVRMGEVIDVLAMFRDSHVDPDGLETVVHEYELAMTVGADLIITGCEAAAHVLPWPECPAAAASAHRLVGLSIDAIAPTLRESFHGTSTCTHLNDLLRSTAYVAPLLVALERFESEPT